MTRWRRLRSAYWPHSGLPTVPVSINVSPALCIGGEVHWQLARHLAHHQVSPDLIEVEITESAMMGNQPDVLSQLQKLKMDVLKVDRAFTNELGNARDGKIFFQAIVSMAHALGMTVVAEGVETAEQLAILQTLSCNEVQGYYVSRPVPANEMARLMQRRYLFESIMVA